MSVTKEAHMNLNRHLVIPCLLSRSGSEKFYELTLMLKRRGDLVYLLKEEITNKYLYFSIIFNLLFIW